MRGCVLILLLIHLVKQIQILDAFILSCNASLQTVKRVPMCPSDMSDYEEAVKKKNCSSSAADAHACKSFEYHCVLSDDLKYAIEVCAPGMYIVGYVCTKFSTSFRSIIRIDDFPCNDSTIQCPYRYNSTLAFRQTLCYSNITYPLTTDSPLSRAGVVKYNATEKTKENDNEELKNSEFLFLFLLLLLSVPLAIGLFICRRRWIEVRRQTDHLLTSGVTIELPHVEDPDANNIDPLLNTGGITEHPHVDEPDATNIDPLLISGGTTEHPHTEDADATNIDPCYHASTKTTLHASSERDQLMLKCPVNLLIQHLRNPDESWTKDLIIEHVEDMIQRLVNSNDEQLFISFMNSLNNDEMIATTLLKCGEQMFKLISSIQERYAARKIAFTDGCVCVTFSFANADDLNNYVERVRNKDEQLITDLSRILLNKTLLRIFHINPELVLWKATELKVYKGFQLVDTETLQEPLKGDSEDFTGIGEGNEETYKKRLFSKSREFSEDFEKKCNKFSSEEPIEYPGYKNYNTRAKSFDGAGNWLEVKKNEFAKFGFLYKGIGLKTACFCCGCFKDDWTKEDNIFETHGFLKKSCLYFQYINTLLIEQK